MANKNNEIPEEEMTVELDLEGLGKVECEVITVLEVNNKDYIVLTPIVDEDNEIYGDCWFYRLVEDPKDPNAEPELIYINDEEEYSLVDEAFDEYLDGQDFDEIIDEDDE